MDLILVMKERLRDQNSETRSVIKWYLYLAVGGFALMLAGLYVHPDQAIVDGWRQRKQPEGSTLQDVSAHTEWGSMSLFLVVIGHFLMVAALRLLMNLSRVRRSATAWQSPQRSQTATTTVGTPQRVGTPLVTVEAGWQRYAYDVASCGVVLILWGRLISFGWVIVMEVGLMVFFGNLSYHLIGVTSPSR